MDDVIRNAKQALDERLAQIGGCSNGNCQVVKPKGMHTNGGCHCLNNWMKAQRVVNAYQIFTEAVMKASGG